MRSRIAIAAILFFVVSTLALFAAGNREAAAYPVQELKRTAGGQDEPGLVIVRVLEDSPAERAGLTRGDILLEINGQEVNNIIEVRRILAELRAGEWIDLSVRHGDEEKSLRLKLEDRLYHPPLGVVFGSRRAVTIENFTPFRQGALVMEVLEDSPAAKAGIRRGDIIVSVEGEQVGEENSLSDLVAGHGPGDRIIVGIRRLVPGGPPESLEMQVELAEGEEGKAFLGVRFTAVPGFRGPFSERFETQPGEHRHFHFQLPDPGFEPGPHFRWFETPQQGEEENRGQPETSV
jgi:S1-C subfamily serine protease